MTDSIEKAINMVEQGWKPSWQPSGPIDPDDPMKKRKRVKAKPTQKSYPASIEAVGIVQQRIGQLMRAVNHLMKVLPLGPEGKPLRNLQNSIADAWSDIDDLEKLLKSKED